ncbi:MAG: tRNA dihydrouridine synthase DusB [Betaproteobacteria bacterium]|nr:MAG: tRNA dihydrouridine synthase DusB [Betaproteobacteria bacterium]
MQIGRYSLQGTLVVAPMAGVTDRPFRTLCRTFGAALAVSEMIASNPALAGTAKTQRRMDHAGETPPVSVQIAGADPGMLAEAARFNADRGADIIDINMGCPAKKVCNVAAGSALLRDEALVGRILDAVVNAVEVPVTLKIRTGWDASRRNAARIARIAEQAGIQAIAIHGRTRADAFLGAAEYDTIAEVKANVAIPVIANGDVDSPQKARFVLKRTGADALMIGRAAQGRPWIFREIAHYLEHAALAEPPSRGEVRRVLLAHLAELHAFYGEFLGVRVVRKHVSWYTAGLEGSTQFRHTFNRLEDPDAQLDALDKYFRQSGLEGNGLAADAREELAA